MMEEGAKMSQAAKGLRVKEESHSKKNTGPRPQKMIFSTWPFFVDLARLESEKHSRQKVHSFCVFGF